ncbi:hypothetical protein ECANGB1_2087 [Enterospora canceri]|uniref:FAR-17a/AIG1-like protein n=1 Tax=Enterospora canceri TaxID=1081671 RepID=A0A1Y1S9J1_9MICR|nr:hypothetical protein ECANGB1_2087 [Enterospora canceri]
MDKKFIGLIFYILMLGWLTMFLFDFAYPESMRENNTALGKLSHLTYNGLILTCTFILVYVLNNMMSEQNKYLAMAEKSLFTLSINIQTVITILFWVIYLQDPKNFKTEQQIAESGAWDLIADISTHILPYCVLLFTFIVADVFIAKFTSLIPPLIFAIYYYLVLYYCNIIKKTPVYKFTANYTPINLLYLVLVGLGIFIVFHFAYWLIDQKVMKRKNKLVN